MKDKEKECSHDFVAIQYYRSGCLGETIEKEVKCKKCGLKAREVWVYSCMLDENNNEI